MISPTDEQLNGHSAAVAVSSSSIVNPQPNHGVQVQESVPRQGIRILPTRSAISYDLIATEIYQWLFV